MIPLPFAPCFEAANSTIARTVRMDVRVFFCECVPMLAVRLCSIMSRDSIASQKIFSLRNWLKMIRVHARTISAKMIDRQFLWNRPDEQFVGESVGKLPDMASHTDRSVTVRKHRPFPQPTGVGLFCPTPEIHGRICWFRPSFSHKTHHTISHWRSYL